MSDARMDDTAAQVERLGEAVSTLYSSQTKAAKSLGWSQPTLNRTLDPTKAIRKNVALLKDELSAQKGVRRVWIETGEGEMLMSGQGDGDSGELPKAQTREEALQDLPEVVRQNAALLTVYDPEDTGEVQANRTAVVGDRREVQRHTRTEAKRVRRRYMEGDAMGQTITPNAECYCVPVERFEGPGIYYLLLDERPVIARLQPVGGGAWLVKYDSASYDDELLVPDKDEAGRYVSRLTGQAVELRILERVRSFIVEG